MDESQIDALLAQYLVEQNGWTAEQYRLEHKGSDPDGNLSVWAVFLEDEIHPVPGGGKSVDIRIEPSTGRIVKVLGWQ